MLGGRGGGVWPAAHSAPPPLHPHSSLFSPAAWMKGITTHLNNSTQHVPRSPTTSTRPHHPPTASGETRQRLSTAAVEPLLFVLLFIARHAPPCDCRVGRLQAALAPQHRFMFVQRPRGNICLQFGSKMFPVAQSLQMLDGSGL